MCRLTNSSLTVNSAKRVNSSCYQSKISAGSSLCSVSFIRVVASYDLRHEPLLKNEMKVATSMSMPNLQTSSDEIANGSGNLSIDASIPSSPSSNSSSSSYNAKPCAFFAKGNCRNGAGCRFSHSSTPGNAEKSVYTITSGSGSPGELTTPPPPILINLPPGHPVYSIDVECVATGVQHNARSIAQVALVDEWSRPVFSVLIKQDMPVLSYITELTGLTKEILDSHGLPLGKQKSTAIISMMHTMLDLLP